MSRMARTSAVVVHLCVLGVAAEAVAQDKEEPPPRFEVYGFAQADYIQDFMRVNPAWVSTLRPTRIPTVKGAFGQDGEATLSVRQSRLGVKGNFDTDYGLLATQFEIDMFGVGVDEGQTTIRLRHAWGELGAFGGGQTHSLFMDIDVFPNVIDYWGPNGMVFLRNPQLRWSPVRGDLSVAVAIERPTNDIDPGTLRDIDPALSAAPHPLLPDLSANVRVKGAWGHVQLAGIVRALGFETLGSPGNEPSDEKVGWGANLSTNLNFLKKDRLILAAVYGHGIASYMNDGGVDLGPETVGGGVEAKAVPLLGVVAYIDHWWTERWSTSLGYSQTRVWNTDLQLGEAFHYAEYASANVLWTPMDRVLAGIEVLWGRRVDRNGNNGRDARAQLSLKYSFSSL